MVKCVPIVMFFYMYVYMILGYVVYMDMHTIWLNHVHVRKYYYIHVHVQI